MGRNDLVISADAIYAAVGVHAEMSCTIYTCSTCSVDVERIPASLAEGKEQNGSYNGTNNGTNRMGVMTGLTQHSDMENTTGVLGRFVALLYNIMSRLSHLNKFRIDLSA